MEMAEYIEREAAIDAIMKVYVGTAGYKTRERVWETREAIQKLPASDVAPVVHGRWLCVDTDTEHFFLCNRCKKKEFWESNYCPNCGARMDGDSDAKAD